MHSVLVQEVLLPVISLYGVDALGPRRQVTEKWRLADGLRALGLP